MKKIRRTKIRFQTNELLIVRRDGSREQNSAANLTPDSVVSICPLCHSLLAGRPPAPELPGENDIDSLNEEDDL